MKILNTIKGLTTKVKAKHMQKTLIKTEDDKFIVEALPAEEDNSAIDIHKVLKNMDDPETMAEVVENNLEELMEQNHIIDAMKYLNDSDVLRILNENNKKLQKNEKIKLTIEAIDCNDKKIKAILKNLESLNDCELGKIFETFKPETQEKQKAELEEQKINIITKRILRHMINNGAAWHLNELTRTLKENSKLTVINRCLITVNQYQKERDSKEHITSSAKVKLVTDMLRLTKISHAEKQKTLNDLLKNGSLNLYETETIQNNMKPKKKESSKLAPEEH